VTLRKVNSREISITTTEGKVRFKRWCLQAAGPESRGRLLEATGSTSVFPLDEHLGVDDLPFRITCEAALAIARAGVSATSYVAASRLLKEHTSIGACASTVQRVTNLVGSLVRARELELVEAAVAAYDPGAMRAGHVRGRIPRGALTIYMQVDGAMYNTTGGGWKEAKLAVCFRSTDLVERVGKDGKAELRLGARDYAGTVEGVEALRRLMVLLAVRNGLEKAHNMVIIGDGAPWIRGARDELFPFAVLILDLFHLKENVGAFARHLFPDDPGRASEWATSSNQMLEEGKWRDFLSLGEVAPYATRDTPKGVVNIHHYVRNNRDAIDYPKYRARGYFVGSGAIESANRSVMQRRLKQPGAKWEPDWAGGVLSLRCKLACDRWETDVAEVARATYRGSRYEPKSRGGEDENAQE